MGRTCGASGVCSVKNSTAYQAFMTAGSVKDLVCSNINKYFMDKLAYVCVTVKLLHIVLFASRQCKKKNVICSVLINRVYTNSTGVQKCLECLSVYFDNGKCT